MNNSFTRLVDGMSHTLKSEVLPRLDDEYARSQVWGVINALNTFRVRADWSAGFLLQQIEAQQRALALAGAAAPGDAASAASAAEPVAELLARRDAGNRLIGQLLAAGVPPAAEQALREAMRAELEIELRNSPRPLFAEMSGGGDA